MLPRIFWTIDGAPVGIADWAFSNSADLGYDQFRGVASGAKARAFAHQVTQGSVVRGFTEHGAQVWEGGMPQPPKFTQDGLVHFAAQGWGYQAAKYTDRIAVSVVGPGAWVPADTEPLNFSDASSFAVTPTSTQVQRSFTYTFATSGQGSNGAVAFWAPRMKLSRLQFASASNDVGTAVNIRVWSADGPDVQRTRRIEYVATGTNPASTVHDITASSPGDCWIIDFYSTTGGNITAPTVTSPRVWGDFDYSSLYSEHALRIIANRLGWDATGIVGRGAAPHYALDWAGDAASYASYITGLEDWCWGAWQSTSNDDDNLTPYMTAGPYGRRTWEVSAATGATWDLDPLERYRRVVVQFLNVDNSLNQVSLEAPGFYNLPDSVQTELRGSIADSQQNADLAFPVAWRILQRALDQRYRGNVSFARAFESGTGREATYEVRAGDLIKITDFALDGSLTLRIHDVDCTPSGVTIGIEAPALPLGGFGGGTSAGLAIAGSRTPTAGTEGTAAYIPPGSSGGAVYPPDTYPDLPSGPPKPPKKWPRIK